MQIAPEFAYPAVASLSALCGSVTDVRSRRIPNFITAPSALLGLMLHLALGGWRSMAMAAVAGLICGAVFLVFYLAGGMGAGDVKLIAAVGCLVGISDVGYVLVLTAIAGGVMAVAFAMMRGRLWETFSNVGELTLHHRDAGLAPHPELNVRNTNTLRLPYGLAIASGCLLNFYLHVAQR
jgi:prepilin peptidase CpaA